MIEHTKPATECVVPCCQECARRRLAALVAHCKAEGAAEERTRHQADCERALLEMEESATRRERKACAKLVLDSISYQDDAMFAREVAAAILARGGKK